jgi:hypothetical protein
MTIRLNKVTRDLNVGITTVVDFLQKKGYSIEASPNAKITEEQYAALVKEFSKDKDLKMKSEKIIQQRQGKDQIKKAKPKKLYFYSNKARVDRPDEVRNNEEIRSWVKEIDWDCELHTFFREEYVDVYTSVQGAMDWVFENEEQAIVLEDDCVPSVAFF